MEYTYRLETAKNRQKSTPVVKVGLEFTQVDPPEEMNSPWKSIWRHQKLQPWKQRWRWACSAQLWVGRARRTRWQRNSGPASGYCRDPAAGVAGHLFCG